MATDCHSCHQSPPPTGEHFYHMYTQENRPQITCDECHQSSIQSMHWYYKAHGQAVYRLYGFESYSIIDDTLKLVIPYKIDGALSLCEAELRENRFYLTSFDTLSQKVGQIERYDSLYMNPTVLKHFGIDPEWLKDKKGNRHYLEPKTYNRCEYDTLDSGIYKRERGAFSAPHLKINENSRVIRNEEENQYFFILPDSIYFESMVFIMEKIDETPLGLLSKPDQEAVLTKLDNRTCVLRRDGEGYYKLTPDSLVLLTLDTLVDYEQPVFATTTSLHGNGKVDIQFKHQEYTLFKRDTVEIVRAPVTGEIRFIYLLNVGAWNPERKTCYSSGIANGDCHFNRLDFTRWYPHVDPKKAKLAPLGGSK